MTNEPLDKIEIVRIPNIKLSYFALGIFFWINLVAFGYLFEQLAYNLVLIAGLKMDAAIWTKELVSVVLITLLTIYGFNKVKHKELTNESTVSKLLRNLMISYVVIQCAQFVMGYFLSALTVSMISGQAGDFDQHFRFFNSWLVIVSDYVKYILVAVVIYKKRNDKT